MSHTLRRHSVVLNGHRTSVSVEDQFWNQLRIIADSRSCSLNALITTIDSSRTGTLSGAIRLFVLEDILEKSLSPES